MSGGAKQTSLLGFFSKAPKPAAAPPQPETSPSTPPPTSQDAPSSQHASPSATKHASSPPTPPRPAKQARTSPSLTPPPSSSPAPGRRRAARRVNYAEPRAGSDDDDDGYDDEYPLEDVEVAVADYMQRVNKANFQSTWDDLGSDKEKLETYSLSAFNNLEEAMKNVICFMGMQPCERTDKLQHGKQTTHHSLKLAGLFRGEEEVLVQIKLAIDVYNLEAGVTMQLAVRCPDPDIAEFIAGTIQ